MLSPRPRSSPNGHARSAYSVPILLLKVVGLFHLQAGSCLGRQRLSSATHKETCDFSRLSQYYVYHTKDDQYPDGLEDSTVAVRCKGLDGDSGWQGTAGPDETFSNIQCLRGTDNKLDWYLPALTPEVEPKEGDEPSRPLEKWRVTEERCRKLMSVQLTPGKSGDFAHLDIEKMVIKGNNPEWNREVNLDKLKKQNGTVKIAYDAVADAGKIELFTKNDDRYTWSYKFPVGGGVVSLPLNEPMSEAEKELEDEEELQELVD